MRAAEAEQIGVGESVLERAEARCFVEIIVEASVNAFIVGAKCARVVAVGVHIGLADHSRVASAIGDLAQRDGTTLEADTVESSGIRPLRPTAVISRGQARRSTVALAVPLSTIDRVNRFVGVADIRRVISPCHCGKITAIVRRGVPLNIWVKSHGSAGWAVKQRNGRGKALDIGRTEGFTGGGVEHAQSDVVERLFVDIWENIESPGAWLLLSVATIRIACPQPAPAAGRKVLMSVVVHLPSQANLFEMVCALQPVCGLARRLHRGKEQREQDVANSDDHQ